MIGTDSKKQEILKAYQFRHACKVFDTKKRFRMKIFTLFWRQVDCLQVQLVWSRGSLS